MEPVHLHKSINTDSNYLLILIVPFLVFLVVFLLTYAVTNQNKSLTVLGASTEAQSLQAKK